MRSFGSDSRRLVFVREEKAIFNFFQSAIEFFGVIIRWYGSGYVNPEDYFNKFPKINANKKKTAPPKTITPTIKKDRTVFKKMITDKKVTKKLKKKKGKMMSNKPSGPSFPSEEFYEVVVVPNEKAGRPYRATKYSVGRDLFYSGDSYTLKSGETKVFETGTKL